MGGLRAPDGSIQSPQTGVLLRKACVPLTVSSCPTYSCSLYSRSRPPLQAPETADHLCYFSDALLRGELSDFEVLKANLR